MATKKRITVAWLQANEACEKGIRLFEKVFPRGAAITERNTKLAAKANLPAWWFASQILSARKQREFSDAWVAQPYALASREAKAENRKMWPLFWKLWKESRRTKV